MLPSGSTIFKKLLILSLLSFFPTVLGQGHNRPSISVGQNPAGRGGSSTNSISGGEVVQIARFYLVGAVKRPGAFALPRDSRIFISQALAEAGGPLESAQADEALLIRWDENGQRQEIPINVSEIIRGKKSDLPLQPNDILFLPGSKKGRGHPIIDPPIEHHQDDNWAVS